MKKSQLLLTCFAAVLLAITACSGGKKETSNEKSESVKQQNTYEGKDLSINVIDFDKEKNKTNAEILNGLDKDIKSISGRLVFFDEAGNEIAFSNGRSKSSPFQLTENPFILASKTKKTISFSNKIESNAAKIDISIESITTTEGEKIEYNNP